ncbi:hypothetical protein P4H65_12425 [Paenibacillus chitinolyticus]|uniref:hypothetical protein n=1 Tax=Paenibacillus chitinolyticus TaxID=79263 RepID=UPI002DB7C3F7|nr:hypothetical protein [Paenibacillus chitinolyticus]MEC0246594.1 hypothetical protein [Paenibacillus chitinolyticus]
MADGAAEGAADGEALTADEGAGETPGAADADGDAEGFKLPAGVFSGAGDGAVAGDAEAPAVAAGDWTGLPEFDTLELPAHPAANMPESSRTAEAAAVFFMVSPKFPKM